MSAEFELSAEIRNNIGKSASRRSRRLFKKVPAVVYGGKQPSLHLEVDNNQISRKLKNESFYSHILTLNVNGQNHKVVLKAIQRHPVKSQLLHIDFQRISETDKLIMHVPIHFIGESVAPGVKKGGVISHLMTTLEISCLPSDLPEFIEVDVSALEMDELIHLSQIKLPKGVQLTELLHNNDAAVISIHMPRVAEEPSSVEAPTSPTEPEVIKEKKKEE